MLSTRLIRTLLVMSTLVIGIGCGKPSENDLRNNDLRNSFAQQLAANKSVKDFQRDGDEMQFTGPGADGTVIKWRVHIDSSVIEETTKDARDLEAAEKPYKGTVKSSWYAGNYKVEPD